MVPVGVLEIPRGALCKGYDCLTTMPYTWNQNRKENGKKNNFPSPSPQIVLEESKAICSFKVKITGLSRNFHFWSRAIALTPAMAGCSPRNSLCLYSLSFLLGEAGRTLKPPKLVGRTPAPPRKNDPPETHRVMRNQDPGPQEVTWAGPLRSLTVLEQPETRKSYFVGLKQLIHDAWSCGVSSLGRRGEKKTLHISLRFPR